MTGRNEACPCGSGKKYKRCCGVIPADGTLPSDGGKFRFEPGSYGGPDAGYAPSILCQKQLSDADWRDHFVLANPDAPCKDEVSALAIAEADLGEAFGRKENGGTDADVATLLKSKGYMSITGFNIIREENTEPQAGVSERNDVVRENHRMINFQCKKCRKEFDCYMGKIGINKTTMRPDFEKPIVCPR
jgi:hypothetical protein